MKLCLKLEDDHPNQNPIVKAKIPITIFNQPFASSLTTTTPTTTATPKDVSFSLSTDFPSGPSLKLTYAPSSSTATATGPFSLSLKSGLGLFGSPRDSPLIFTANFSLSTKYPTFSLHFKPQFGDFSLHRSTSSANSKFDPISGSHSFTGTNLESGSPSDGEFVNGFASDGRLDSWQELKLEPCDSKGNGFQNPNPGNFNGADGNNGVGYVSETPLVLKSNNKGGFLPGIAIKARTVLPLTKRVKANLRWGLNFNSDSGIKMPYLTLHKIVVERAEEMHKVEEVHKKSDANNARDVELLKGMYFWMNRDLEVMTKENREMMQCLEEMKSRVVARNSNGKSDGIGKKVWPTLGESSAEFEHWRSKKNSGDGNGQREVKKNGVEGNGQRELKKSGKPVSDVEAELQRAIKAASS